MSKVASFSFSKRKSLKGISDILEDIPQNDDEIERQQRKRDSGRFGQLASTKVSLGGITELSISDLGAHFANCMRLSAENKINHKNAFNLPLIDCMKLLLINKDEQMNNFQVVGCTLDASAKIYASRVDRVHMDGMSFAKGLGGRSKDSANSQNEANEEEMDDGQEDLPVKKKRAKKARKLSRDVTKINICTDDNVNDPTFVILRKQFNNCQPSFISFIPKLELLGDDCKVLLDMNEPFLPGNTNSSYEDVFVPFDCEADGSAEIVPQPFREILSKDCDDLQYDTFLSASMLDDSFGEVVDIQQGNEFENDPIVDDDAAAAAGDDMLQGYSVMKDDSVWKGESRVEIDPVRTGCAAGNGPREKVVDVQKTILQHVKEGRNMDYLYTNLDRMLCAGPAHWQSLPKYKVRDKNLPLANGPKRKEKKVVTMDFTIVKDITLVPSKARTLTTKFIENNWSTSKITIPADLHLDIKILTRYFNRPRCGFSVGSSQNKSDISLDEEEMNDYDYDNFNDSQHCPAVTMGPGSDGDNSANKELPAFEEEPAADIHSCEPSGSGDAWSMVDPPAKVARIHVPYAQHAKKIDMKILKTVIWSVLCEDGNSHKIDEAHITPKKMKKNSQNIDATPFTAMSKETKFSEMEKKVLKLVPPEMAQELTMPLVFTALLHLANERVLYLTELDDHSDIIIEQDRGADSFVKKLGERQFV